MASILSPHDSADLSPRQFSSHIHSVISSNGPARRRERRIRWICPKKIASQKRREALWLCLGALLILSIVVAAAYSLPHR
jgi:hypothetical protein